MRIAIIGAGAMGSLYGAKLSTLEENEVFLIDVWRKHVEAINNQGLYVVEDGLDVHYRNIKAAERAEDVGICDLAIVFVKSTLTEAAVKSNRAVFGPDTIVVTLQNGLGNVELIEAQLGDGNIIAGTTSHGATMLAPGRVLHAGIGKTMLGELTGIETDRLREIAETFGRSGIETSTSDNISGLIWDKLLVNVGINALTAITGLHNGEILNYPELKYLQRSAVNEAHEVALAKGIELQHADPVKHVEEVCIATSKNQSSMLQDIINKKQTEIDMINGAVCREGENVGIATPVNSVLTYLVLFKQRYK